MEIAALYALRSAPHVPLSDACLDIIRRMRRSPVAYRPSAHAHKKSYARKHTPPASRLPDNWRQSALLETHRRMREREDPDYDTIVGGVNKLSKQFFTDIVQETLETLGKRDHIFRLRVASLLFDRGIRQCFFAPLVADFVKELVEKVPDLRADIETQVDMFDTLYDSANVTVVPSSDDPAFADAIIAWTKLKETKRGYAVLVGELFQRGLVPHATMGAMLTAVLEDLQKSARLPKTDATMEHVDHLGRFLFAVAPHVQGWGQKEVADFLAVPRDQTPSLNMKTRFKLEDALKLLKNASA